VASGLIRARPGADAWKVNRSTAQGLAGGGALLAAFSLLTPWYVLSFRGLTGQGRSGAQALGALAVVLVALAVAAGWSATGRIHQALPFAAACGLGLLVAVKVLSPPSVGSLFPVSTSSSSVGAAFARSVERAFAQGLGLHFAPTWGIWLAAIGALMAVVGTFVTWRASEEAPAQPLPDFQVR
jgi:hypothetical protein